MHFRCVDLSNSTARHTRHVELDWLDTFDTMSATGATRNFVCCVICIKLWYVSYSLIYWSIHLIHLFYSTEHIEHKNDKTCTGEHYSLFVVRRVGTAQLDTLDTLVSTRSTRRTCRVVSRRDVTSQVEFGLIIIRRSKVQYFTTEENKDGRNQAPSVQFFTESVAELNLILTLIMLLSSTK